MKVTGPNHSRTSAPADQSRSLSPTMYLVRLRVHLSRGRVALGEAIDAVTDVLPIRRAEKRSIGRD